MYNGTHSQTHIQKNVLRMAMCFLTCQYLCGLLRMWSGRLAWNSRDGGLADGMGREEMSGGSVPSWQCMVFVGLCVVVLRGG